jgi:sec-independent protein translocase protein TatA
MLAFIDSPIQIAVVMVVVLLVFGPEKMKDIGKQLGRAIREIRRAGSDFRSTLEGEDNRYDTDYTSPRYDNYSSTGVSDSATDYNSHYSMPSVPEDIEHKAIEAAPAEVPEYRGDFAAAALADTSSDYAIDHSAAPAAVEASSSTAPIYGVLTTPEQSVPREKSAGRQG